MIALSPHFTVVTPTAESIGQRFDAIDAEFARADSAPALLAAVALWDTFRRELRTWGAFVNLRFSQDTRDASAREAREHADALSPAIQARETTIKGRLLDSPYRSEVEERLGAQAFRLWKADAATYAPQIDADLIEESELEAQYTALIGAATVEFRGKRMTLAEVRGWCNDVDRATRHAAERARWSAYEERGTQLDEIFDRLVTVRTRIATALGYDNFVALGYARMHRVDYDAAAVAKWRESVVRDVVPLASQIVRRSAIKRGYDRAMYWDEASLVDAQTRPILDADGMLRELPKLLAEVDPRLADFATFMRDNDFLDVKAREGKGPGGFCTSFPTEGHPYVFASFNGTKDDVKVLIHEMGHAFQSHASNALPLADYLTPTFESAEIHSMSLEYLSWPTLERYLGENAEPFRAEHLASAMLFLPYGCAVDHFQEMVYTNPQATPDERRAMWQQMERLYLPLRDYGDVAYPSLGNFWQYQLHIYRAPFYYIDYTLAMCCALQFWVQARRDHEGALDRYIALCARGGSASFTELVASAGLASPFDGSALRDVVHAAGEYLRSLDMV